MQTESIQSLAYRLKEAKLSEPKRFIFFLGAGASDTSGIPITSWMIRDFERNLKAIWKLEGQPNINFNPWLRSRPGWKSNKGRYAKLFEAYEPTENGRIRYLNKWMASASPSWGYFCLAQLLARSYVSTIVTTNFDDLIYESCTQLSTRRPRVYSVVSPYASVEHDHDRPTIIKLHGDYLYRDIRNTSDEIRELDQRLLTDVSSLFQRHEIIVLGYGGSDKLIMERLFANVPPSNAVYWCTHKDDPIPDKVNKILSNNHSDHWFEIKTDGFDAFMDELLNQLDFTLPGIIQPMQGLIDAIPGRIEGSNSRYVDKYLAEAIQQIKREEEELARAHGMPSIPKTPYRLRLEAMNARRNRKYDDAIKLYRLLTALANQDTCEVLIEYAVTLELMGNYSEALKLTSKIERCIASPEDLGNFGWLLANLGRYDDGIRHFRSAISKVPGSKQWPATLALILSEAGHVNEALRYAQELTELYPEDGLMWATRSTIESLAGNYAPNALEYGAKAVALNPKGFQENLSLAFAQSGSKDNNKAIASLSKIDEERDEIYYRCLGHFQVLLGNAISAVDNLQKSIEFTQPASRPKILALYGVALLAQGSREEAQRTFDSALSARDEDRSYKVDDELAFALCELGDGQRESGASTIQRLSEEHRPMKGLLLEFSALLGVMASCGIEGCDRCITLIDSALSTGGP